MSLPASFVRKSIKDSKGGWTKANSKPRNSGGLLHHDRKTFHKKMLDLFLFSRLGFEPDEQCYFDHDVPPTCTMTIPYAQRQQKKARLTVNHCLALAFHMGLPVKYAVAPKTNAV